MNRWASRLPHYDDVFFFLFYSTSFGWQSKLLQFKVYVVLLYCLVGLASPVVTVLFLFLYLFFISALV